MVKIDKDHEDAEEQKVAEYLRAHAKDSVDAIAKQCHLSPQKVSRIIAKLEREKRIWGYSAIIDDEYYGFHHFYFLISRTTVPLSQKEVETVLLTRIEDILPGSVIIENIEMLNGSSDAVFSFFAKDLVNAKRFVERFQRLYQPFVRDLQLFESVYTIRRRGIRNPNIMKNLNLPLVDDMVNLTDLVNKKDAESREKST